MAFNYYQSITVDKTKVPNTDQTNFPVYVGGTYAGAGNIADLRTVANGGKVQNANGYDIYFYSDSTLTTRLAAERVVYNATTGVVEFHVKIPTLTTATDYVFYMAYGDSSIATDPNSDATYGKTSTWNSNFKGVYHYADGTTLSVADSTATGNNGTNTGITATTGKVDGGANASSTVTNRIDYGDFSAVESISTYTMSCWLKPAALTTAYAYLNFVKGSGATSGVGHVTGGPADATTSGILHIVRNGGNTYGYTGTGKLAVGTWAYLTAVYDGGQATNATKLKIYINGTQETLTFVGTIPTTTPSNSDNAGSFGSGIAQVFEGVIDESRISVNAQTSDWINTEYNNLSSPSTFYTNGTQISINKSGFFFAV